MNVIAAVVIGFNMVGTKQHEGGMKNMDNTLAKLKDSQFGCKSRATTTGGIFGYSLFLCTEQVSPCSGFYCSSSTGSHSSSNSSCALTVGSQETYSTATPCRRSGL